MVPLLILAGGRATRLGPSALDCPKFLMPISEGRVFADVQLEWVREQGFEEVVLSLGYRADMIRAHVANGSRYGLRVRYSEDGPVPLGTGGAVKKAFVSNPQQCAVLYGDTMLDLPCREIVTSAVDAYALMTVSTCPPNQKPNAHLREDGSALYDKVSADPRWTEIDYGFSVLSAQFIADMPDTTPLDVAVPLSAASKKGQLRGWRATKPFYEINTPEMLEVFRERFGKSQKVGTGAP